jgi:hypothetical protein
MRLELREGRLMVVQPALVAVTPLAADRFRVGGFGELTFALADGRVTGATHVRGGDTTAYVAAAPPHVTAGALAAYAGEYVSDELELRVTIVATDSTLVMRQRPRRETTLRPLFRDGFGVGAGTLVFTRDAAGRISGFGISAGRIRNVRFERR